MNRQRVIVMGAAGRDFHDFNVVYRDDPAVEVVAFTATQIPGIANRVYPSELAGPLYPSGIPIRPEEELDRIIRDQRVQPRDGHAHRLAGARRGRRLRDPRSGPDHARQHEARDRRGRDAHRRRQEPDHALSGRPDRGSRPHARGGPPSDAIRQPHRPARPALRDARGPTTPPSRNARSTSRISMRDMSSSPGSTTRPSCGLPRPRPT